MLSGPIETLNEMKLTEPVQMPSSQPPRYSLPPVPRLIRCAATRAPLPTGQPGCNYATGAHSVTAPYRQRWWCNSLSTTSPDRTAQAAGATCCHDAALVAAKIKGKRGPLSFSTVSRRLAVRAKWHRLKQWVNPVECQSGKTLLREVRKAQTRQGVSVRKKTAVLLEPL